jgi:hypothetical protein
VYNGQLLFQKQGDPEKWLRFSKTKKWMFSPLSDKDANNAASWCKSVEDDVEHPSEVKSWTIYANGDKDESEVYAEMACTEFSSPRF